MRNVSYCCDHCEKEVSGSDKLYKVYFQVQLDGRCPGFNKEICIECMQELGFEEPAQERQYISNYCHIGNNWFEIIKKLFKR
jgi:hypothetical protein